MNKLICKIIAVFILIANTQYAQGIKMEWGKPKEVEVRSFPLKIIGVNNGIVYVKTSKGLNSMKEFIEKYDEKTNTLISVTELKSGAPHGVLNGELISIDQDIENGKIFVGYKTFNANFEPSKETKQLFTAEQDLIKVPDTKEFQPSWFTKVLSEDKKQILFYRQIADNKTVEYYIVGEKFAVIKGSFKYETSTFLIVEDVIFTNNTISLMVREPRPKAERAKSTCGDGMDSAQINYNYSLLVYKMDENKVRSFKPALTKDNYTADADILVDKNQNIVLTGEYKYKEVGCLRTSGMFSIQVDTKTSTVLCSIVSDFPKEVYENEREFEKGKGLTYGFRLSELETKEDGSLIYIYEDYRKIQHDNAWHFMANGLIVINCDKNGKVLWTNLIPKQQQGDMWTNGMYLSFISVYSKNNLYLIYNENPKNMQALKQKELKGNFEGLAGSVTAMVTVNCTDGKWKKEMIYENLDNAFYINPPYTYYLSNNEIIIRGQREKAVVLGKLKIQ